MWQLRLAARSLWRTPAFTGVVVLILGLGIGANATLFSIADAVLFRPFPFVDQQRLVIAGEDASEPRSEISYRAYLDWRANLETFADLGVIGSTNWTLHLRLRDGLTAIPHRSVSANFFEIVGAKPYLGRTFDASDDRRGAARTLILGYGFWQRQFGGNPRVVGQVLASTEGAFTVVGVMPPDFRYPAGAEAWTPGRRRSGGGPAQRHVRQARGQRGRRPLRHRATQAAGHARGGPHGPQSRDRSDVARRPARAACRSSADAAG